MGAPRALVLIFLRKCQSDGNDTFLDTIATNFISAITERGGAQLQSASAAGKSFSYGALNGYSQTDIMSAVEDARRIYAEIGTDEDLMNQYLNRGPSRQAKALF